MMWHDSSSTGWMGSLAMALWMILFWGGLILLVLWAIRSSGGAPRTGSGGHSTDALSALEERFARGDIDDQEFKRRRAALMDQN